MAFCAKCGTELSDGVSFCPKCGAPVKSKTTNQIQVLDNVQELRNKVATIYNILLEAEELNQKGLNELKKKIGHFSIIGTTFGLFVSFVIIIFPAVYSWLTGNYLPTILAVVIVIIPWILVIQGKRKKRLASETVAAEYFKQSRELIEDNMDLISIIPERYLTFERLERIINYLDEGRVTTLNEAFDKIDG